MKTTKDVKSWIEKLKLDHYLIASIVFVVIYDIVQVLLFAGVFGDGALAQEMQTLTVSIHGFFGTEIAACAFLKKFKNDSATFPGETGNTDIEGGTIDNAG